MSTTQAKDQAILVKMASLTLRIKKTKSLYLKCIIDYGKDFSGGRIRTLNLFYEPKKSLQLARVVAQKSS